MGNFISELLQYKFLIHELVIRDIKKKYRRSVLGVVWSILNPLLMMSVTAMVFSTIFRFSVENYPLYLLIGQIMFTLYAESTSFAMSSIIDNGSLIKKVYIPKYHHHTGDRATHSLADAIFFDSLDSFCLLLLRRGTLSCHLCCLL